MVTILTILMVVVGLVFSVTVMLMNPKGGGLGAIGGMSIGGTNEYGSKKSLDSTLKKTAIVSGVIFAIICIIFPYIK